MSHIMAIVSWMTSYNYLTYSIHIAYNALCINCLYFYENDLVMSVLNRLCTYKTLRHEHHQSFAESCPTCNWPHQNWILKFFLFNPRLTLIFSKYTKHMGISQINHFPFIFLYSFQGFLPWFLWISYKITSALSLEWVSLKLPSN